MKQEEGVIVVGAGPVGLLNALGLARAGVPVTLIEAEPAIADSPRAMVYHWSVLEGIEKLGILDEARQIGFLKQDYSYFVWKSKERITWSLDSLTGHVKHPYNLHLGQNRLAEIALTHLRRLPNVEVYFNTTVVGLSQDAESATLQTLSDGQPREFTAAWVLGADGARSAVRGAAGLGFDGMTWPERFVATNVRFDFESAGYARANLVIDPVYGAIIAKIDETGLWRCTYCESAELPEDKVLERMPEYYKVILPPGSQYELVQHSPYRMHQRSASKYRDGRVLLAGDAAHSTNPTGGLGLTSGLFDTFVLYEALAAVAKGEVRDDVLDRYSDARRKVFLEIASPQASENKRLIYHSSDPARLEEDLKMLRRMQTDADFRLERMLFTRRLSTPSLIEPTKATA